MGEKATLEDIAYVIKLLERLRTGELKFALGDGAARDDASTAMLQRVEGVLNAEFRRMQEPTGDGGPAFPVGTPAATWDSERQDGEATIPAHWSVDKSIAGMSLRDYFAAKALPMLIDVCRNDARDFGLSYPEHVATCAYAMADAMLRARAAITAATKENETS